MNPKTIPSTAIKPSARPAFDSAIVAYTDLMCRVALSFTHDAERARGLVETTLSKMQPIVATDRSPVTKSKLLTELRRSFMSEQRLCSSS